MKSCQWMPLVGWNFAAIGDSRQVKARHAFQKDKGGVFSIRIKESRFSNKLLKHLEVSRCGMVHQQQTSIERCNQVAIFCSSLLRSKTPCEVKNSRLFILKSRNRNRNRISMNLKYLVTRSSTRLKTTIISIDETDCKPACRENYKTVLTSTGCPWY